MHKTEIKRPIFYGKYNKGNFEVEYENMKQISDQINPILFIW